ncbi:MAG: TolC family protein [Candidatus Omnitrophota bacterium]
MRRFILPIFLFLILQISFASQINAEEKEKIGLSLGKVSELALENNLDIQITRFDAYIKRNDLYGAVSIFDTILSGSITYEDDQRKSTSSLAGSKSKTTGYEFDLEKKLPMGTTLGIGFDHTRNWSNSAYATTNPAHDSQASLFLTQEIGKNFFGLVDRNEVKITKLDIENSDYTSIDKIEQYLADVQKAYWKVVLNREKVKIREEMLDRATSLYKIYQQKTKIGLAENPDLYAVEANMNIRKNELLSSQNDLRMAENNLLLKLNMNDREKIDIVIEDLLNVEGVQEQAFIESLKMAINNRRDYKSAFNEVEAKNLKVAMKKNNLWPEIDLEASITRNGVAKYYKDAMDDIIGQDNPQYYYGIKFKYPLENSSAKGQYETAKLEKAKSLVLLKKKEREIVVEVNDAVGTVNTTLEKVKNNYIVVNLQEKKLGEEEKRFKLGRSNSDTLIRFHDDLLVAKISLADSLYQYNSDFIDLRVGENSLLGEYWKDEL